MRRLCQLIRRGEYCYCRLDIQRQRLKKHIFKDLFARKRLSEITRTDVLDLLTGLLKKNAPATVNKALGIEKVIFREALYREKINRDP